MKKYLENINGLLILFSVITSPLSAAEQQITGKNQAEGDNINFSQTIIIVGASYAASWKPETIAGLKTVNKGVGGSETSEMLARYQADVLDTKPKAVIIWGFINDIFRSQPESISVRITTLKENLVQMVELAQSKGIKPILATEVTITARNSWKEKMMSIIGKIMGKESYHEYVNKKVVAVNEWLRDYADQQQLPLLDFEKVLADEDGNRKREFAVEDGSHLTGDAYGVLSSYVERLGLAL